MAEYLANIFGSEKDKVNCSFYYKIGACRHGDRCSRIHIKPTFSQTILIQNLYQNPQNVPQGPDGQPTGVSLVSDEEAQEHFDDFFEDVFVEIEDKYGEIEEMNVCDNLGDHLIGNVYVMFRHTEDAERAVKDLNTRWFNGRPIYAELSPVTDFREACCRQYELGECTRSGFCNFMHIKPISRELKRELYGRKRSRRSRSRSTREHRRRSKSTERRSRRSRSKEHRRKRSRSRDTKKRSNERRSRSHERKRERRGDDEVKREQRGHSQNSNQSSTNNNQDLGDGRAIKNERRSSLDTDLISKTISNNLNEILSNAELQFGDSNSATSETIIKKELLYEQDDASNPANSATSSEMQMYYSEYIKQEKNSSADVYRAYDEQEY